MPGTSTEPVVDKGIRQKSIHSLIPFRSLIPWRQCLLSGGTEACSLGLRETPACIHVIQRLSQPRVACWHGFRPNSQKTECAFTRCPTCGRKFFFFVYTASEAKGLTASWRNHFAVRHVSIRLILPTIADLYYRVLVVVRMWVWPYPAWPVAALVSLSKTLNQEIASSFCMGRDSCRSRCESVMHVKEPRTLIVKEKGLCPSVSGFAPWAGPAGWICAFFKRNLL